MFDFDPSKMDPKMLMQMSELVRQLPPDKLNRMQSLMHNMMAGFDVSKELEEFEKTLPSGFREKLVQIVGTHPGSMGPSASTIQPPGSSMNMTPNMAPNMTSATNAAPPANIREARLTILRGVSEGHMTPEEALKLLFDEE